MKIRVFLILLFLNCRFFSQENASDSVRYYTSKSVEADNAYRKNQALFFSEKAIQAALKNKNELQIIKSYIFKSELYARYGFHNESFKYINLVKEYDYYKSSNYFQAKIKLIKSINYSKLGLDSLYLKENKEILTLLDAKSEENKHIKLLLRAINRIEHYYDTHGNPKLSEHYSKIYESIIKKKDPDVFIAEYSGYLSNKGQRLLEKKQFDSVLYYFQKDYDFVINKGDKGPYIQLKNLGDYYYETKNHYKALEFYEKAMKTMEKVGDKNMDYYSVYKRISELYGILGKKEDEVKYLKKYTDVVDTSTKNQKPALQKAVAEIVKEEKEVEQEKIKNKIWWLSAFVGLLITGFFFCIKKLRKKKNLLQEEFSSRIKEKEDILEVALLENQKKQVSQNISLNDLVEMAKQNELSFLANFEAVFPNFRKSVTEISSDINNNDLEILAFTYLGFSSKEIAKYNHKSVRTIQNKKYIIRKKLNIDGDLLLEIWIKNLILKT